MDKGRAERVSRIMMQERPDDAIKVLNDYGAAALMERERRQQRR
jgi:hypothetical protein